MSRIEERDGDEGFRHYLDGRGVHCGEVLELRMPAADRWLPVRFELEHRHGERVPVFFVALGGTGSSAKLSLPFDADLRWCRR